jgi:hypothetical protein
VANRDSGNDVVPGDTAFRATINMTRSFAIFVNYKLYHCYGAIIHFGVLPAQQKGGTHCRFSLPTKQMFESHNVYDYGVRMHPGHTFNICRSSNNC